MWVKAPSPSASPPKNTKRTSEFIFGMWRLPVLLFIIRVPATADTVYKCSDGHGHVSYQKQRCASAMKQEALQVSNAVAAPAPMPPTPGTTVPAVDKPAPEPSAPRVRLTKMYQCMHAVDGGLYVSSNGHPRPFLAPLGMLGALPNSLSDAYGQPGGAGISAPEATRGRVSSSLVAGSYTQIQDQCRPMSVPEICDWLRDQNEANERKLQRAFKSDQPPLLRRETELRAQLTRCASS
jgi:hypothetical protein